MIYDNDAGDIQEGDHIIFTKKVVKKIVRGDRVEFVLDDGERITHVEVNAGRTLEVSNHPIKVG